MIGNQTLLKQNIAWLFAERILRLILTVGITIFLARYLGAEQYGILSWAIAITTIAMSICQLGLEHVLIKELTNAKDKSLLLGSASLLKLSASLVAIISLILWAFLSKEAHTKLVCIMAIALLWGALNTPNALFQSQQRSRYIFITLNAQVIFSFLLKLFGIINKAPLETFAYIYAFDGIASVIAMILLYQHNKENPHQLKISLKTCRELLSLSWPLLFSGIFIAFYTRIDILLLKSHITPALLGNYCFTVALVEAFFFIPYAISNAFFPTISQNDNLANKIQEQRLFDALVLSGLIVFILINILGPLTITRLLGEQYAAVSLIIPIYSLRIIFGFIGWGMDRWLIANGLQIYSLYRTGMGLLIGFSLNLLLIPYFSVYGAAFASIMCAAASSLLIPAIFPKSRPGCVLVLKSFIRVKRKAS